MKKIFLLLTLLCSTLSLSAGPIGEARARQIAEEFFTQHTTRSLANDITLTWAGNTIGESTSSGAHLDTALMYIYNRGQNQGFVVVAGDSNVTPIIAYSLDSNLDTNDMAVATRTLLEAWCKQVEAARKEQIPVVTTQSTTRNSVELLYETALWNQGDPYNREAPVIDGNRSVTGCAATAMAILCYYYRWPDCGVGTTPEYEYYDRNGYLQSVPANQLGRYYDYDNMLFDYNNGFNTTQANAVAALMKDMGTSIFMSYHYMESGASVWSQTQAMCRYFKYSKDAMLLCLDNYDINTWYQMMRDNLDTYGPTLYSGASEAGGHAFVLDGYNGDYFHINYGWGGSSNGWYILPYAEFYIRQAAICYLKPDKDGTTEYRDNLQLNEFYDGNNNWYGLSTNATKYEVGGTYTANMGAVWNVGPRTFDGDVSIVHCDKYGNWKEQLATKTIYGIQCQSGFIESIYITINTPVEEGDRLRIYFKSSDRTEWEWVRTFGGFAYDEVLMCSTPKEVSQDVALQYEKDREALFFITNSALQLEIHKPDGTMLYDEVMAHDYGGYLLNLKGEYIINLFNGGQPHTIKLTL